MMRMLLVAAGLLIPTLQARNAQTPSDSPADADCSFGHPQLPGRCNVTVPVPRNSSPQQACEAVLRCINGTQCRDADKYCPNPGVAKTWKLEQAIPARPRLNCAYSNPGHAGWWRLLVPVPEGLTPRQACEAVLACLNGSPCDGFSHYNYDPNIRSGWRLEEITPAQPHPTPKR